jgi:hypothetical protein
MKARLAAVLTVALGATAARAAALFEGRWAADPAGCSGEAGLGALLVVTPSLVRWRENACIFRTSYLVGAAWHLQARCWGEGVPADVPIKMQLREKRLLLDWARSAREELQRCP